jgi:hypothetical protein
LALPAEYLKEFIQLRFHWSDWNAPATELPDSGKIMNKIVALHR